MAATTATVMAIAKTTTGKDNKDNGHGRSCQWARTATTTGEDKDIGKDGNSEDDGDKGKDDRQGRLGQQVRTTTTSRMTTGKDDDDSKDNDSEEDGDDGEDDSNDGRNGNSSGDGGGKIGE